MITLCAVGRFTFCSAEINFLIIKFLKLRDLSLFLHSRLLDLHSFAQENVQIVRYENEKDAGPLVTATPYSVGCSSRWLPLATSYLSLSDFFECFLVGGYGAWGYVRSRGTKCVPSATERAVHWAP